MTATALLVRRILHLRGFAFLLLFVALVTLLRGTFTIPFVVTDLAVGSNRSMFDMREGHVALLAGKSNVVTRGLRGGESQHGHGQKNSRYGQTKNLFHDVPSILVVQLKKLTSYPANPTGHR
jgi:hypothetical protein